MEVLVIATGNDEKRRIEECGLTSERGQYQVIEATCIQSCILSWRGTVGFELASSSAQLNASHVASSCVGALLQTRHLLANDWPSAKDLGSSFCDVAFP